MLFQRRDGTIERQGGMETTGRQGQRKGKEETTIRWDFLFSLFIIPTNNYLHVDDVYDDKSSGKL